jgi:hypothetical protein
MGYIIKNTSGLINTRLTDTARQKISQGKFNISFFQIGDSEVTYNTLPSTYNQANSFVLEPSFNAQNSVGVPQSNKQNVKYPYYVDGFTGNTYGIPFMDSIVSPVYNVASPRGFFQGTLGDSVIYWSALTMNCYAINANYVVQMNTLNGSNVINLISAVTNNYPVRNYQVGDIITIIYDGMGNHNSTCFTAVTTTTTTAPSTTTTTTNPCDPPIPPTTTTTTTCAPIVCGPCQPIANETCVVDINSCYSILTYRITGVCLNQISLDRNVPDFSYLNTDCYARTIIYPSGMTEIYDSVTPQPHYSYDVINYESVCLTDQFDVKIWNMNIPWSETPAGINTANYNGYNNFGSVNYLGSKEYFGYASSSGQTTTVPVYYYNSFQEPVVVTPEEQKAIAIIHYTNQTIDFFYGEKFALEPFDPNNPQDTTGQARNFKLHIPWLMWHKNPQCCFGETFYVDPSNEEFEGRDLFQVEYIESTKNLDMNSPGIRYYNLWDTHAQADGLPSRVGKVFPDSKIIIIDDEEIIAAMSYKSNRNWTLPAPKVSLITPNTCGDQSTTIDGVLSSSTETLYVTYRLSNDVLYTNSLHCNYYQKIQGPNVSCNPEVSQNVSVRFGSEFRCINYPNGSITTTTTTTFIPTTTTTTTICPTFCNVTNGFYANKFEVLCQKVVGNERPNPSLWKIIDFTSQLSASTSFGYIVPSTLSGNTFVISKELYDSAPTYDLSTYIDLTPLNYSGSQLNFGDEYYFYGNLETDIQATIYEMRYKVNLGINEFQTPSNPTWSSTKDRFVTEIGLYDDEKNLMILSKLSSPIKRQGIQQFLVKFDL